MRNIKQQLKVNMAGQQGIYVSPPNITPNRDAGRTDKQARWLVRNRILWRLKGMVIPYSNEKGVLTSEEKAKLDKAFELIREVTNNSVEFSRKLGFNAVKRCRMCNRPAVEGQEYCKKHLEEYGEYISGREDGVHTT